MPPDDRRGSKKRSQKRGGPGPPGPPRGLPGLDKGSMGRRYASHNQLDSIAEASDESGQPSPERGGGDPWSSSPGKFCWGVPHTVWKFHNFSITQFLRAINLWDSRGAKSAILTHLEGLNSDF